VDGDAAEGSIAFLYLTNMNAAPNADAQLLRLLVEAAACPDRAYGALKGRHQAVARLVDERAAEGGDGMPAEAAVLSEQVRPALVSEPAGERCRTLDVAL
jgi:hypothetical protein